MKVLMSQCNSCQATTAVTVKPDSTINYPKFWTVVALTSYVVGDTYTTEWVLCPDCSKSITLGQLEVHRG